VTTAATHTRLLWAHSCGMGHSVSGKPAEAGSPCPSPSWRDPSQQPLQRCHASNNLRHRLPHQKSSLTSRSQPSSLPCQHWVPASRSILSGLDVFSWDILGNVSSLRSSPFGCLAPERSQKLIIASAIHMKCAFMSVKDIQTGGEYILTIQGFIS